MAFKLDSNNIGDKYTPNDILAGKPTATLSHQYSDKTGKVTAGLSFFFLFLLFISSLIILKFHYMFYITSFYYVLFNFLFY